jgi:transposase
LNHPEFKPGECAQIDFGAGPKLIDETTGEMVKTWIFVMVLSWSRHMYAEIVLNQTVETWLSCHRHAFEWFGGVPKKLIIDYVPGNIINVMCHSRLCVLESIT